MHQAVEWLRQLVGTPSVSSQSNEAIIRLAEAWLSARHWKLQRQTYRGAGGVEKVNLIACTSAEFRDVELALAAHVDTVPWPTDWIEATTLREHEGWLHGRGACDMKGFVAAILSAVGTLDVSKVQRPLAIVLTADEELGCIGAKHLITSGLLRARHILVGEPTSLRPVRAGKGYAVGEIVVRGREVHSAYPALGRSAIFDAARVVAALERLSRELTAIEDRLFDPPFTTLNVGLIQGGTAKNIIPGTCSILVEWRPLPGPIESVPDRIQALLADLARSHQVAADFTVTRLDPGFAAPEGGQLVQWLEAASGQKSDSISYGTEAALYAATGAEAIVCGPGDMRVAHGRDERIAIEDLLACEAMLKDLIRYFCQRARP